jgi:hypothetical protein
MDVFGKCDGFVEVTVGEVLHRSKVVMKEFNPVWNLSLPPQQLRGFEPGFHCEVFDWDKVGKNDLIGTFDLSLAKIFALASMNPAIFEANRFSLSFSLSPTKYKQTFINFSAKITWPADLWQLKISLRKEFLMSIVFRSMGTLLWRNTPSIR